MAFSQGIGSRRGSAVPNTAVLLLSKPQAQEIAIALLIRKSFINRLILQSLFISIIQFRRSCLGMVIAMQLSEAGYITHNTQGAHRLTRKRKDKGLHYMITSMRKDRSNQ